MVETPYLPWYLGGDGDIELSLGPKSEHPYPVDKTGIHRYTLITMGYHVGGLIHHFFTPKKNDFLEMALHHIVAIYLFAGMYLINLWTIGSVIAYLHDIADITTNIVKPMSDTNSKYGVAIVFAIHMLIWGWTRLIVLPYLIYRIAMWHLNGDVEMHNNFIIPFFCYLLSCMFCLHIYWYQMFIKLMHKFVKFGSTEDKQNDLSNKADGKT